MTLFQEPTLTGRMKILCLKSNQPTMKTRTSQWYQRYAEAVLSALQHSRFERFLGWLIRHECIPLQQIKAIHIRTFPRIKANGRSLNGSATKKGVITLYPPTRFTYGRGRDSNRSEGFPLKCVQWRARAILIHEILHYKYHHHEHRVRQLTQQYTQYCMQPKTGMMKRVFNHIFRTATYPIPKEHY